MSLALNEEQRILKESADAFFASQAPVSALRRLRDEQDPRGFCPDLWRSMVDMGWAGTFLPEQYGGLGCGFRELGVVMEAGGRTLAASPLFSSIVLGASCVLLAGTEAQKSDLLPALAGGELLLALALQESPHYRPGDVATSATAEGDGFRISGRKVHVIDGHCADRFIVAARTAPAEAAPDGISLFLVDTAAPGVGAQRRIMVDSRNMAEVSFDDVRVEAGALLGPLHGGGALLERVVDRGNIALAAEMLGCALEAFERTLDYLRTRQQFGAYIGTFQALQHRAAQM
ncbi:MAG: acyl-CoA dehydrogenase family protein, partial [Halioglobus sp.]|nr:acyl-CoA dehydrogenase family protein [Halioglobus sp.]